MKMENSTPLNERIRNTKTTGTHKTRTEEIRQGFRIVGAVPTKTPRNYYESIVIYVNGATRRLYVYDEENATWRYATLT